MYFGFSVLVVVLQTGLSGSGKSSLGSLLLRLYEPQRGTISIEGLPINEFDERFIRSLVGAHEHMQLVCKSLR